jgi:hypothetical protein
MGTLRWEKEQEERAAKARREADLRRKQRELALAEAEAQARIRAIQHEIDSLQYQAKQLGREDKAHETHHLEMGKGIQRLPPCADNLQHDGEERTDPGTPTTVQRGEVD